MVKELPIFYELYYQLHKAYAPDSMITNAIYLFILSLLFNNLIARNGIFVHCWKNSKGFRRWESA